MSVKDVGMEEKSLNWIIIEKAEKNEKIVATCWS